jgi:hypothetical protein
MSQAERGDWADKLEGIDVIDGTDPFEADSTGSAAPGRSTTRTRRSARPWPS